MTQAKQEYCWGLINPASGEGDREKNEDLLPPEVTTVVSGLGISDYTQDGVNEAMVRYDSLAEDLVARGAQRVVRAGAPRIPARSSD